MLPTLPPFPLSPSEVPFWCVRLEVPFHISQRHLYTTHSRPTISYPWSERNLEALGAGVPGGCNLPCCYPLLLGLQPLQRSAPKPFQFQFPLGAPCCVSSALLWGRLCDFVRSVPFETTLPFPFASLCQHSRSGPSPSTTRRPFTSTAPTSASPPSSSEPCDLGSERRALPERQPTVCCRCAPCHEP
jgi:hypothetical protein